MAVAMVRHSAEWALVALLLFSSLAVSPGVVVSKAPTRSGLPRLGSPIAASQGSQPNYDEQIGLTFTDTFTSLAYNVTAVSQANSDGYGPAYLLNGLTDSGYWYQVGVSWDWDPGVFPGSGFGMNYEAWDTNGHSIFPTDGGGGLLSFSGPVNGGDTVELSLNFTGTSVVMHAQDLNTGAEASIPFSSERASSFVGLINPSNSNGYFSGLMTEEYHSTPYFGNVVAVNYSSSIPLGNGFLWADEFSVAPRSTVFYGSKFVSFASPTQIQTFSKNGTTSYANARSFVTGVLDEQRLTLSYSIVGGGSGYGVPFVTYVLDGVNRTASLTQSTSTFLADTGSTWQVSSSLMGGAANERWATTDPTSGVLTSSVTEKFYYYHQYLCKFGYYVTGGATGFGQAGVQITQGGSNITVDAGASSWADAQTAYVYSATQKGAHERWVAKGNLSGVVDAPVSPVVRYFHQFGLSFSYALLGGGTPDPPTLSGTASGATFSSSVANSTEYFLDSGTNWSVSDALSSGDSKERWVGSAGSNGTMLAPSIVVLTYQNQYTVGVFASPTGAGTVTHPDLWENVGATLHLSQNASRGWKFAYWSGVGTDISNSTTVQVNAPVIETAVFYPGLNITAGSNGAVAYVYGSETGTVPAGTSKTVYAGPGVEFTLQAMPSSFLYAFSGWSRNSTGTNTTTTVQVETPKSVAATYALNVPVVAVIGVIALVAVAMAALGIRSRTKTRQST